MAATGALAVLAGCGGEEDPQGRTATVAAGERIDVVGTEYAFDPQSVVVEGTGEPLEVILDNQGSLPHNLAVFDGGSQVGATATIQGGESDPATLELEPGAYRMVCTVGNHEELGMVGDLEVRSGGP